MFYQPQPSSKHNMLKTGIYVDAENIRMGGGYRMRYDVLSALANTAQSSLLRANCYLAEDKDRIDKDYDYQQRVYTYHSQLRRSGFKLIKKRVRRSTDEEGNVTTKANADMDLAVDALLQASNLDRIILLTGDSDFVRLVIALQNMGCRVEVIGFNNVSKKLKETADSFQSGFMIPGLLPIDVPAEERDQWQRGRVNRWEADKGWGFFSYYKIVDNQMVEDTVFFHVSKSTLESDHYFKSEDRVFEFFIYEDKKPVVAGRRFQACDIRLPRFS